MSNNDRTVPTITSIPETEGAGVEETKTNLFQKTKHFVKTHKKPAIAVGALVALVGVAAVTGNKKATVTLGVQSPFELENAEIVDSETVEDDTVTA